MQVKAAVKKIIQNYESESPAIRAKLAQLLMHGNVSGTGKLMILAVDQGFEHGPGRAFLMNRDTLDPQYHLDLAIDGGMSALAAPLGLLECIVDINMGRTPLILKLNSSTSFYGAKEGPDQALTATVRDALRLGCIGVGFTIYPGSSTLHNQLEELRDVVREAKEAGLLVIVWSYPRGHISKDGESAIDVVAYGAHVACLMGAHIVKVKVPNANLELESSKKVYSANSEGFEYLAMRIKHVVDSCLMGRRMVIFSGGEAKDEGKFLDEVRAIRDGGGFGSIIGRNAFQRPRDEALTLIESINEIYQGKKL